MKKIISQKEREMKKIISQKEREMKKIISQKEAIDILIPQRNGLSLLSERTGIPTSTLSLYRSNGRKMSAASSLLIRILITSNDINLLTNAQQIEITHPRK